MNIVYKFILVIFLAGFFHLEAQNIAGSYFPAESKCPIYLKIDKNNHFIFTVKNKKKIQGAAKLSKEDQVLYLDFGRGIGGMFSNDTIYMQNAGNAMNPYNHFKECNEMYIHWVKKQNQ